MGYINKLAVATVFFAFSHGAFALLPLSDDELSATTGQALLTTGYTAPSGAADDNKDFGFFKIGLEGLLELNTNIGSLKLGCKGVGNTNCDIDIDKMSLSGSAGGPDTSAQLTNPFFEFAIKNPNSASTREIVGFRVAAEQMLGMLTAGENNKEGIPNGINRFSGYMKIAASSGRARTAAASMTNTLTGRANIGGCTSGCPVTYITDQQALDIPADTNVGFTTNELTINTTTGPINSVTLSGITNPGALSFAISDQIRSAQMQGCFVVVIIPLCDYAIRELKMSANIINLKANLTINENLGLVHKIPINSPLSLSLQRQAVFWPGEASAAQKGWWMAFKDPIQLGDLSPSSGYAIDISPTFNDVALKVSKVLTDNPIDIPFGDAVGSLFTSSLTVDVGNINLSGQSVNMDLTNLPLGATQNAPQNCWGGNSFC